MFKFQSFRRLLSFRTTINPSPRFHLKSPKNGNSLVLITTPSQLQQTIKNVYDLIETRNANDFTIVTACVDTVAGKRNAVSELWFNKPITIENYKLAPDNSDAQNSGVKSSFSAVAPVRLDKNWKDETANSSLNIEIPHLPGVGSSHFLSMSLANTLFTTGEYYTSFFYQGDGHPANLENSSSISIRLPPLDTDHMKVRAFHQLTELDMGNKSADKDGCFQVTDFTSNMIEKINGESAARYLIENTEMQKSKQDVFMELIDPQDIRNAKPFSSTSHMDQFYRIVVGGLGWGEKQEMIVLDPIVGNVGYRYCRLFQHDPNIKRPNIQSETKTTTLTFDCSEPEPGFRDYGYTDDPEIVLENVAGLGNEKGFSFDGVWHTDKGSMLTVTF